MDFELMFWIIAIIVITLGAPWILSKVTQEECVSRETIARIENGGRHL